MGNEFLQDIRKTNALIHVVRTFTADEIIHIDGSVSPIRDIQIIDYEMIFADLLMIEKLLQNKKHTSEKKQFYKALHTFLEHENHIRDFCPLNIEQKNWIKELNCLTAKPMLVLCNGSESTASYNDQLQEYSRKNNNALHFIDVIHPIEEQVEYLTTVIHKSLLQQNTYFTAGINEARSWSVPHGCTAAEAAGKIHSDFSKKMVKAQVISFKELCLFENWKTAYKYGKIRTEGRLYLVQDGDIIYWLLR
jgi:ribosome-binding ATPase YchF (GTP1/OBG family)